MLLLEFYVLLYIVFGVEWVGVSASLKKIFWLDATAFYVMSLDFLRRLLRILGTWNIMLIY